MLVFFTSLTFNIVFENNIKDKALEAENLERTLSLALSSQLSFSFSQKYKNVLLTITKVRLIVKRKLKNK